MKYLNILTEGDSLRSKAVAWELEDTALINTNDWRDTPSPHPYLPDCVLEALGEGFRLLGPPTPRQDSNMFNWWLESP
jgi:hypothetical protein